MGKHFIHCLLCFLSVFQLLGAPVSADTVKSAGRPQIVQSLEIAKIDSAFPVGYCLLTHGDQQYVAYYDTEHNLTVASRSLNSTQWEYQILPSKIGWDSQNYVTMGSR